ncbi:MAG: Xylose ABC transporter, permease protein XylH, partial [uncultured Rubellimicrobium sp.]
EHCQRAGRRQGAGLVGPLEGHGPLHRARRDRPSGGPAQPELPVGDERPERGHAQRLCRDHRDRGDVRDLLGRDRPVGRLDDGLRDRRDDHGDERARAVAGERRHRGRRGLRPCGGGPVRGGQWADRDRGQDRALHRDAGDDGHLPGAHHLHDRRRLAPHRPGPARRLPPRLFRQRSGRSDPDHHQPCRDPARRVPALSHQVRAALRRSRGQHGRGALFGRAGRAGADHGLRDPGPVRRRGRDLLRAAPRRRDPNHRPALGASGHHGRRHRRHRAARRQGAHLGHRRGRPDPGSHREPHGPVRHGVRIPRGRRAGGHHHRRHAGPPLHQI